MNKPENRHTVEDGRLAGLMKRDVPQAPATPWFVNKVVNRLPRRALSPLERAAYAVGLAAVLGYAAWAVARSMTTGVFTVGMLAGMAAATGIVFAVAANVIAARAARG